MQRSVMVREHVGSVDESTGVGVNADRVVDAGGEAGMPCANADPLISAHASPKNTFMMSS